MCLLSCSKKSPWHTYSSANTPLSTDLIRQILVENNELAWVGTYGGGLYHLQRNRWEKITAPFQGDYILSLVKDPFGALWVGTARHGAFRYTNNTWEPFTEENGLAGNNVWAIGFARDSSIWFCSRYQGVCKKWQDSLTCLTMKVGLPDRQITLAVSDSSGRTWLGTVRSGLAGYKDGQFTYLNTRTGLSGNYIRALICDSIPRWVGSWDGGLDWYTGTEWKHISDVKRPVVFLGFDAAGVLWVGTWGHGVFYCKNDIWEHISSENSGLPDDHVIDIDFTENGTVFFSTSKGIGVYTPKYVD